MENLHIWQGRGDPGQTVAPLLIFRAHACCCARGMAANLLGYTVVAEAMKLSVVDRFGRNIAFERPQPINPSDIEARME